MKWRFLISALLIAVGACSSEAEPGEPCELPGGTEDVCAPGTVCGKPADKALALVCIPLCSHDDQCLKNYDCKGVEGTPLKGCRLKD